MINILKTIITLFSSSQFIPMPVLYGVLLYMGISSLKGMQLVDRILLMMMPPKYQPDYIYLRHVPLTKVHIFTLVQVRQSKKKSIVFSRTVKVQIFVSFSSLEILSKDNSA